MLIPGGPLNTIAELIANKSNFTGQPITRPADYLDSEGNKHAMTVEAAAKVAKYLYQSFAPNIAVLPGTYSWDTVGDALHGRTDPFGREVSVAQAVANSVGVKLGSYPEDVLNKRLAQGRDAALRDLEDEARELRRRHHDRKLSDADFQAATQRVRQKEVGVRREFMEHHQ
jgi:hypothetical protein